MVAAQMQLTAAEIRQQVEAIDTATSLQRGKTAAVLCNYYGATGLTGYGYGAGFDPQAPSTKLRALEGMTQDLTLGAVVDTRLSQTVRVPDLRVQTMGSSWAKQRSARKIGQWLSGSLRRQGIDRIVWQVAADASLNPMGAARVWFENDGMHVSRVRPDQIYVNPREGKRPRSLYLRYGVPRAELAQRFADHATHINSKAAPSYKEDTIYTAMQLLGDLETDLVEVIEHWNLGANGKPGTYTIVCGDEVLNPKKREWKHPWFPVVELVDRPSFDTMGGRSLGEILLPSQMKLRAMDRQIDIAQERMSKGKVYLPIGSRTGTTAGAPTDKQQFSRTAGEFIEFNASFGLPVIQPGTACAPEYYQRRDRIEANMWELGGVSKSQGTGTIPAGLAGASGKAQREFNNTAASRQKQFSEALDGWFERLCTVALGLAIEHFSNGGEGSVVAAPGTKVLQEVDFKKFDLKEGEGIEIRCISVAGLPAHPSARLEYAKEGAEAGFWDRNYAIKLLSHPDLEKAEDIATACFDLATFHVEETLDEGREFQPEEHPVYLQILLDLGTRELMNAIRMEAPEENIEKLRRLLEIAKHLQEEAQPAPQAATGELMAPGQAPAPMAATPAEAAQWGAR